MANPLFQTFGKQNAPMPGLLGQFQNMASEFKKFANNFHGDPRQKVEEMLKSGEMTQDQYNQLEAMARQLQKLL